MQHNVLEDIKTQINTTFNALYGWFTVDEKLLHYRPTNSGWSVGQNLEHVSLTNHYLLILIRKATGKAVELAVKKQHAGWPEGYVIDWQKLEAIGQHGVFAWIRPQHMEPTGSVSTEAVKISLQQQETECLQHLSALQNGEGVLYKTMMTVNGLGKIDVYHYILFLVQHIKRHLMQVHKIKLEFDQQ